MHVLDIIFWTTYFTSFCLNLGILDVMLWSMLFANWVWIFFIFSHCWPFFPSFAIFLVLIRTHSFSQLNHSYCKSFYFISHCQWRLMHAYDSWTWIWKFIPFKDQLKLGGTFFWAKVLVEHDLRDLLSLQLRWTWLVFRKEHEVFLDWLCH